MLVHIYTLVSNLLPTLLPFRGPSKFTTTRSILGRSVHHVSAIVPAIKVVWRLITPNCRPHFWAIILLTETCTTLSHHRVTIEKSLKMIFVSDSEHEMPGHLDSDLYCQQWVRLSMLWEDLVSNFHIISEAIYSPIIVSLFSMGFCLYCHHCAAAVATSDTDRALSGSLCCSNSEATV